MSTDAQLALLHQWTCYPNPMPRTILKRGSSPPPVGVDAFPFPESSLRHVNFPRDLSREHQAHSSNTYDRSPIVVDRTYNCALPERGCPGRTFAESASRGQTLHPRALYQNTASPPCPDLCSSSSESDESSDGFASPPPEPWCYTSVRCPTHISL